jgi:hypothetical protein
VAEVFLPMDVHLSEQPTIRHDIYSYTKGNTVNDVTEEQM